MVIKRSTKKAKITKTVTAHTFRHSFATHLLESGVDLRYIQEISGHKSSGTTEIYAHISARMLSQIRGPIEDMDV